MRHPTSALQRAGSLQGRFERLAWEGKTGRERGAGREPGRASCGGSAPQLEGPSGPSEHLLWDRRRHPLSVHRRTSYFTSKGVLSL